MVECYSELYKEGEVEHINGPTHQLLQDHTLGDLPIVGVHMYLPFGISWIVIIPIYIHSKGSSSVQVVIRKAEV